jgi:hypothetical protein
MEPSTWESVLDDLEHRLDHVEQMAEKIIASADGDALPGWEPPAHLGPLPRHLLDRAQRLLDRQQTVIARIPPLLAATRQQHQIGQRIGHATTRPITPVYVDVTA